jgi:predicted O-methyltransferase YrrM
MLRWIRRRLVEHPGLVAGTGDRSFLDGPLPAAVTRALPSGHDLYEISPAHGELLAHLVLSRGADRVLEFGAGASSRVLAAALAHRGGGVLTSVEQDPRWSMAAWRTVEATSGVDAALVPASVRFSVSRRGCYFAQSSAVATLRQRAPYDLLIVDAPGGKYGRDGTLHLAQQFLSPGALVVADDAGLPSVQWTLASWLRVYPGLRLLTFDPTYGHRGIALFRWEHAGTQWSSQSWLGSCYHAISLWRRRHDIS